MSEQDKLSIADEIIEGFEDFLNNRGIDVPNEDKVQSEAPSTIYGSDYGELENVVMDTLDAYGVINLEKIRNNQFFNPSGEGDPGSDNVLIRLPEPEEPKKKEIEKPIIENGEPITANEFLKRLKEQHDESRKRDNPIHRDPEKER